MLPLSVLENIVNTLEDSGAGPGFKEFTIEVNPDDIVSKGVEYVRGLKSLGVNRVSMGIQSLDDGLLKWMRRRHNAFSARKAYRILRDCGIDNISVDLIFGIQGLDNLLWSSTLEDILNIDGGSPEHISAYQLSIEPGSSLANMTKNGTYTESTDEQCLRQYEILCERLSMAGYHHYEISNFAKPGYEAIHNSLYWTGVPYAGFGPGAHSLKVSDSGQRLRFWNKSDLQAYLEAASAGDFSKIRESELLTSGQVEEERIMLSLRTDKGLSYSSLEAHGKGRALERLLSEGRLERIGEENVRIPESCLFVSDSIIVELM